MAIPASPSSVSLQQGNGETLLTWNIVSGAISYSVQRSTDGVTFSVVGTPSVNSYLDTSVTVGTNYFYQVASVNASGTSSYSTSSPTSIVPTNTGDLSLAQIRLMSKQRADRVNSNFVVDTEWNTYINQSAFELYDLLVTEYEDYFIQTPYTFQTTGSSTIALPSDFYKLMGVDAGLGGGSNGWVSLKKFDFIQRNTYVFPQVQSSIIGNFNLQYRLMGSNIQFIPTPSSGQYVRIWYIPKMVQLLQDSDILSGISGWTEYVIVDAAIKALQKEESDVSILMAQKMALIKRIEESAMNRDAGQPDTISNTRTMTSTWGTMDGPMGAY